MTLPIWPLTNQIHSRPDGGFALGAAPFIDIKKENSPAPSIRQHPFRLPHGKFPVRFDLGRRLRQFSPLQMPGVLGKFISGRNQIRSLPTQVLDCAGNRWVSPKPPRLSKPIIIHPPAYYGAPLPPFPHRIPDGGEKCGQSAGIAQITAQNHSAIGGKSLPCSKHRRPDRLQVPLRLSDTLLRLQMTRQRHCHGCQHPHDGYDNHHLQQTKTFFLRTVLSHSTGSLLIRINI